MVPRRAEGVFRNRPPFAKQHKINIRRAFDTRRRCEDGKDRGVWMVEQYRPDRTIGAQIVFDRGIVAMPCDHVQR